MTSTRPTETSPPGPALPPSEQSELFTGDPFGYLTRLRAEHGSIFTLELGALGNEEHTTATNNGSWVFVSRPHQLRTMYGVDESVASGGVANRVFFGTDERSVGYIDGAAHRRRRGQLIPELNRRRDAVDVVTRVVDRRVADWPRGTEFALFPRLQQLTAEIIVELVCGGFSEGDRRALVEMLPRTENRTVSRADGIAAEWWIKDFVQRRLDGHLARADRAGERDILASLLAHAATDETLTDEVVRDETFSLLYTGFATTANTLSWAFAELCADRGAHDRVLAEIDAVAGEGPASRERLGGLTYTTAAILETMRLHPVSALNGVRMVNAPLEIDGYVLSPGTILVHCAYLAHRDPELFDRPTTFDPERFLGVRTDPYVLGPFGGGARTCVGRTYSQEEMRIILARVLSTVRVNRDAGLPRARQEGLFMAPEDGMRCVVTDRARGTESDPNSEELR